MTLVLMLDDDDKDDDGVGVGGEFAVEGGMYSPQEALSYRYRGCWRRWRSHFPFCCLSAVSAGIAVSLSLLLLTRSLSFGLVALMAVSGPTTIVVLARGRGNF